jgi:HK97 family phage major capsid protein
MATQAPERESAVELHDKLLGEADKLRELRATHPDRRSDTWEADVRQATRQIEALDREFELTRHAEEFEMQRIAWERGVAAAGNEPPEPGNGPTAAWRQPRGDQTRSWGEQFVESDAYKNRDSLNVEVAGIKSPEFRNLLTGGVSGPGSDLFVPVGTPFLPPQGVQQRRLFVRDLLGVQPTNLNSVPYIRELNAVANETGAVSAVPEASAKPEVTMQFTRDDAPIRKLAAWIQATDEALEDAATLRGYIDSRLVYMLALAEEIQIVNGAGTSGNIRGIRSTPNIQTQASVGGDFHATLGAAIGKVEVSDGEPDGIVVHPTTYWTAITTRHSSQFDSGFGTGLPFAAPPPNVWGLPVVRSRTMPSDKALVGNFRLGATLFEREGTVIRSTDSHASLFISNTIVILAEKRDGLAVYRPDWFVDCTVP